MAFLTVNNVEIKGVSACVPERVVENKNYTLLSEEEIEKYIKTTGVERKHSAIHDGTICASDLCYKSAEKLIEELGWDKSEIKLLVFVSQTPDYKLPITAGILQNRLGLPKETLAFDMPLGCPGYLHGLGVISNLLSSGVSQKALLLVGNTQSSYASYEDRSMYLLFGDAGTATALEYVPHNNNPFHFHYLTDGSGKDSLIVPDGGSRNPVNAQSFVMEDHGDGIKRTRLHEKMVGDDVFSYGLTHLPKSFNILRDKFGIDLKTIDYVLMHQANKFLCEMWRRKLKLSKEQVPYNMKDYGNTSGATIPLLMVTNLKNDLKNRELDLMLTAFGVGFAIGTAKIRTSKIVCPGLLTLKP